MSEIAGFDLDEIVQFGDPWHGKLNLSAGTIVAPDATVFSLRGDAPQETGLTQRVLGSTATMPAGQARVGECYLFNPRGLTPAATAGEPGMTWLNYALLAGARRRVYGKNLGAAAWLYKAADATIWCAEVTAWNLSKPSSGPWTMAPVVRLRRFGVIAAPGAANVEQTISMGLMALPTYGILSNIDLALEHFYMAVEDVRVDGTAAMFCLQTDYFLQSSVRQRVPGIIFEVQLEGTPPTATVAISSVVANELDQIAGSVSASYGSPVTYDDDVPAQHYYPSFNSSYQKSIVVGARYQADGRTPELIKLRLSATISSTGEYVRTPTDTGYAATAAGTTSVSGTAAFSHGVDDFWSFTFSGSVSYHYAATWVDGAVTEHSSALDYSVTVDGQTFARTVGVNQLALESPGLVPVTGSDVLCPPPMLSISRMGLVFASPQGLGFFPLVAPDAVTYVCRRYTNSCWGLLLNRSWTTGQRYLPIYGKVGSDSGAFDPGVSDPQPIWCSEHPVTGEILRSLEPVSWV